MFSDHAIVYFSVKINNYNNPCIAQEISHTISWNSDYREAYRISLISKLPQFNAAIIYYKSLTSLQ